MSIELNHTIVHATDRDDTAAFLTDLLGLPEAAVYGPFRVVELGNGVSLDVVGAPGPVTSQHYAFLVGDEEFDAIHARIVDRGLTFWADPFHRQEGAINRNDGGRGLYWSDPDGHNLEIITVPYGG
ncbi:VOC family protein [Nocardioides sp. SLBN-35]|uniref:VOC family protein n=1 Tax=Nocardioides sp. SLBN-35 TaxID=2768445 RepID=UPI0011528AB1|nr:VOC family protein [Nocardioides sp. SLBN-35]TQK70307.1 glyoxalase/bleomycin resistance protein/dioxygenase superfamily protein [Nocardioides sp. SLBN-35]